MNGNITDTKAATMGNSRRGLAGVLFRFRQAGMAILLVLICETTIALPEGKYLGTITLAFPLAGQTNSFFVQLRCENSYWELLLDSPKEKYQVFGSPEETIWVATYPSPRPPGSNTAMIRVFPGSRPFIARSEEHVWVALLSKSTFSGRPPIQDAGLCMAEPSIITHISIDKQDVAPREMRWHNERADGKGSQGRIEGHFKWMASTNMPTGANLPMMSELAVYLVNTNGDRSLVSLSAFTIKGIVPLDAPPGKRPNVQGRHVVYDHRFSDGWQRPPIMYDVQNGNIPSTKSPAVKQLLAKLGYSADKARRSKFAFIVWASAVLITSGLVVLALMKTTKQNKGRTQT